MSTSTISNRMPAITALDALAIMSHHPRGALDTPAVPYFVGLLSDEMDME